MKNNCDIKRKKDGCFEREGYLKSAFLDQTPF